jgi:hypothetical protein
MNLVSPTAGAIGLILLAALTSILAVVEARRYSERSARAHLFWTVGLVMVAVSLVVEAVFFYGTWSSVLAQTYFFLVAVLVGLLSMGSAELLFSVRAKWAYGAYMVGMMATVGFLSFSEPIDSSILSGGVVTGNPPIAVVIASTMLTVPAAAIMIYGSVRSAFQLRQWRLLSLAAGILVISAAGGLYIVSVPITLYFAEFVGVFLLYVGFGGFPIGSATRRPSASPNTSG